MGDNADLAANANQTKTASVIPPAGSVDFLMGAGAAASIAPSKPAEAANSVASPSAATPVVPPTVVATAPDANGHVTLSGTVVANSVVYYSFNNQTWSIADSTTSTGIWNREITLPSTGTTEIYVRAKKGTDYSASVTTTATFTVPAPVVNVSVPTAEGGVTLSGTAPAGYTIYYSVNGSPAVAAGIVSVSGVWTRSGILLAQAGNNAISVYVKKNQFESERTSVNVNFTVPAPTVVAAAPDANGMVTLSGTVMPNQYVQYSFGGNIWLTADSTTSTGVWSRAGLELPSATSTIYVRARVPNTEIYSEVVSTVVTRAVVKPTLSVSAPDVHGEVNISGIAAAGNQIYWSFDGGTTWCTSPVIVNSNGNWNKNYLELLHAGVNTISVKARIRGTDVYSEVESMSVTVTVPAPTVLVTAPDAYGKVDFSGLVTANHVVEYSFDNATWILADSTTSTGAWSKNDILVPAGATAIYVRARIASTTIYSESLGTPISMNVSVPTVSATTPNAQGEVTLSGTKISGQSIYYSFDGATWLAVSSGTSASTWSRLITLPAVGTTTIFVRARQGNFYSESVTRAVTFAVSAPTVTVSTPDASRKVTLSGTVTPGHYVQYSFDGMTWLLADNTTTTGAWSRLVTLPAGITSVYVRASIGGTQFYSDSALITVTASATPQLDDYARVNGQSVRTSILWNSSYSFEDRLNCFRNADTFDQVIKYKDLSAKDRRIIFSYLGKDEKAALYGKLPENLKAEVIDILTSEPVENLPIRHYSGQVYPINHLEGERVSVNLPNLQGDGTLQGPYVTVINMRNGVGTKLYNEDNTFNYDLANNPDAAKMVSDYYYVSKGQEYFESLGLAPIHMTVYENYNDAEVGSTDTNGNIFFSRQDTFSDNGGDIHGVIHEYTHNVLVSLGFPKGYGSFSTELITEALCTYFPSSYTGVSKFNEVLQPDPSKVFDLADTIVYGSNQDDRHNKASWASMLWHIRSTLGAEKADAIILKSVSILADFGKSHDGKLALGAAIDSLVQADQELYGGANAAVILSTVRTHGFGGFIGDYSLYIAQTTGAAGATGNTNAAAQAVASIAVPPVAAATTASVPAVTAVPAPTVVATAPDANGKVTLSGTAGAHQSVQYSFDGKAWVTVGYATSTGAWTKQITLTAAGTTNILVRAQKGIFYSESVSTTVTYTPPPVPAPANIHFTTPTAAGVVTLSGTRAANTSIWYSLDGGTTYKQLVFSGSGTSWSGKIALPSGASTILIQARKTAAVSGVPMARSSDPVALAPITYTPSGIYSFMLKLAGGLISMVTI